MAPNGFDDTSPQLAAELVDHAGDTRPAGIVGVRGDGFIDLAGSEHLPGASAEAATVEKSATEARAVTVFAKTVSSPSLNDRIINFPCGSPLSIMWRFLPVLPW